LSDDHEAVRLSKFLKERALRRKQSVLTLATASWITEVSHALVRIENLKRRAANDSLLPPETKAVLLRGENALRLLNLRTWTIRYNVNIDFILSFLLDKYFVKMRSKPMAGEVSLGITAAALTGVKARRVLEEEIALAFPTGENIKAAREETRHRIHPIEPLGILPAGSGMVEAYGEAMQERQRLRRIKYVSKRAWRGNPDAAPPQKDR